MKVRAELSASELVDLDDWIAGQLDRLGLETQPEIAAQLLELSSDPQAGLSSFARVIEKDPALSGRVLRVSNSALFAQRARVTRVDRACVLLGMERVKAISLGFYLARSASDAQSDLSRRCWSQSVFRAFLAAAIAERLVPPRRAEAFIIGLMLDCGVPLLAKMNPRYSDLLDLALPPSRLHQQETTSLPCTHVDVAVTLLNRWRFPEILAKPISWHHAPPAVRENDDELHMLHRIAYYTGAVELAADGVPGQAAPMPSLARRYLQVEPEELAEVFRAAAQEHSATFVLFADIAESMDVDELAASVHNELTDAVDDAILESLAREQLGRPLVLECGGTRIEIVDEGGGEGVAYLLDDSDKRIIAHRFRVDRESPASLLTALGLEDADSGDGAEGSVQSEIDTFLKRLAA